MSTGNTAAEAPPITQPLVLLKINRLWKPTMTADEVQATTRGWWAANPRRMFRAEYAAGVAGGVIRAVYRIDSWRERVPGDRDWRDDLGRTPKWGFCGGPAPELEHLVGLSVKHLHKQGAANPVVPLNCGDDDLEDKPKLRGRDARAIALSEGIAVIDADTSADESVFDDDVPPPRPPSPETASPIGVSDGLRAAVAGLAASPLHVLSLGSHELFFSNLIAWMVEEFPDQMGQVLDEWLDADLGQRPPLRAVRALREWQNLDVCIDLPDRQTLVLENKTLSMPDDAQLAGYDGRIAKAAGKEFTLSPTKVLFAPVDPGWADGTHQASDGAAPWRWLSFDVLADRIESVSWPRSGSYEHQTVQRFSGLLRSIAQVLQSSAARPALDEPLDLPSAEQDLLGAVRFHHLVKKARARYVGALLRARLLDEGLAQSVGIDTNLSHAQTLLDGIPLNTGQTLAQAAGDNRFQWQIQGGQLRLAVVLPSMAGKSPRDNSARIAVAEQHPEWFDFSAARDVLGDRCGVETGKWLKFNPDFVYRNVKISAPTVADATELGVAYSRRLVEMGPPSAPS